MAAHLYQLFGLLQFRVLRDGVSPEQVQEARTAIEEITVRLAAKRKSTADVKALEAAVGQMAAAKPPWRERSRIRPQQIAGMDSSSFSQSSR